MATRLHLLNKLPYQLNGGVQALRFVNPTALGLLFDRVKLPFSVSEWS
jgi:hypothetical protein